jgi:hypothetical protein
MVTHDINTEEYMKNPIVILQWPLVLIDMNKLWRTMSCPDAFHFSPESAKKYSRKVQHGEE